MSSKPTDQTDEAEKCNTTVYYCSVAADDPPGCSIEKEDNGEAYGGVC